MNKAEKHQVTATELAVLLNQPVNQIVRVCLLKLIQQGHLKLIGQNKLKREASPTIKYQRCLASYYKKSKSTQEAVDGRTTKAFIYELLDKMTREELLSVKGILFKKSSFTPKVKQIIQSNVSGIKNKEFKIGLSRETIRAYAIDQANKKYIPQKYWPVLSIKSNGFKAGGSWFKSTAYYSDRYEAMGAAVRHRFGQF